MAINVDKVYKSVLSILNKEQRGYITPDEFNKIATQSQLGLLDRNIFEYNKMVNMQNEGLTNEEYANLPEKVAEKIDIFYKSHDFNQGILPPDYNTTTGVATLPTDIYKTIDISISNTHIEKVDQGKLSFLNSSPLTKPTSDFPIYYQTSTTAVISPASSSLPTIKYIKVPTNPRWGYTVNATYGTNIYDDRIFVDTGLVINNTLTLPGTPPTASGTGTTAALATTVAPAGGSGATIKVTSASADIDTATVVAAGSGYSIGDVIEVQKELMNTDGAIGTTNANLAITLSADNLYNSSTYGSTNFDLHQADEIDLIISILGLCGVVVKDPTITQQMGQVVQAQQIAKQQQ